jgi:peptidoglycan/xylan/chitin deacetylase (PgdA/CDA1 family)
MARPEEGGTAGATSEPQVEIRRAIPVEDSVGTDGAPLVDLEALHGGLPADVAATYTRCEVGLPVLALTFDDGPHPELTPRLLDTLRDAGVKATFFLVGRNVAAYPAIVRRMVEEGHEVANHSWSHPLLTSYGSSGVESQLRRTHDAIVKACGVAPLHYRPPYGAVGLSQRARIRKTFGYPMILWDGDTLDWQSPRTMEKVRDRVLAMAKPGAIILCHDIHATTVEAMPEAIAELKARGFQLATVTQLIQLESQMRPVALIETAEGTDVEGPKAESGP